MYFKKRWTETATKIEENVPIKTPQIIANENYSFIPSFQENYK